MRVYNLNSATYALQNIERRRLKISTLKDLNDPFELKSYRLTNQSARRDMTMFRNEFHERFGMLCFSRSWHNPVMWSHYGDKHRGICLGFDVWDKAARDVTYVGKRVAAQMIEGKNLSFDEMLFPSALLYTKYRDWSYEQEVRVFLGLPEREPASGLHFVPFDDSILLREVILGPECGHTVDDVRKLLGPDSDVQVIKSRLAFESFRVVPDKRSMQKNEPSQT